MNKIHKVAFGICVSIFNTFAFTITQDIVDFTDTLQYAALINNTNKNIALDSIWIRPKNKSVTPMYSWNLLGDSTQCKSQCRYLPPFNSTFNYSVRMIDSSRCLASLITHDSVYAIQIHPGKTFTLYNLRLVAPQLVKRARITDYWRKDTVGLVFIASDKTRDSIRTAVINYYPTVAIDNPSANLPNDKPRVGIEKKGHVFLMQVHSEGGGNSTLHIINMKGACIAVMNVSSTGRVSWDARANKVSKGVYLFDVLQNKNSIGQGKLIVSE